MTTSRTTDIEDLRETWTQMNLQMNSKLTDLAEITNTLSTDRAASLVRRAMWLPAAEACTAALGLVLCLTVPTSTGSSVFFACLVASIVVLMALTWSALWQVVRLAQVDTAGSVIDTQRRLHGVGAHRIWEWKWVLLLSPVLWVPFFVVVVEGVVQRLGADASVALFSTSYVLVNLLVGAMLSVGLILAAKAVRRRVSAGFLQRVFDDLAGRRLVAARSFLDRLEKFKRESE